MNVEMKCTTLTSGFACFYQHWFPENPRALVVMVHGLGDHSSRYNELISTLGVDGFACAVYDQRGHGKSAGIRGHISSFDVFLSDLSEFIDFSLAALGVDVPVYLVGGSLGGLICINYAANFQSRIAGMILASAAIEPDVKIPPWKQKVVRFLARFVPQITVFNGLQFEQITRDPDEVSALLKDNLFHRRISIGAAVEIENRFRLVMAIPHRIHIPVLVLAGSDDRICLPEGARHFVERLSSSDKCFIIYENMVHDLLHDIGKRRVMQDMRNWLIERTSQALSKGDK